VIGVRRYIPLIARTGAMEPSPYKTRLSFTRLKWEEVAMGDVVDFNIARFAVSSAA
jgi:hypothetical protein